MTRLSDHEKAIKAIIGKPAAGREYISGRWVIELDGKTLGASYYVAVGRDGRVSWVSDRRTAARFQTRAEAKAFATRRLSGAVRFTEFIDAKALAA